jgi:hypothetical protein
MATFTKADDITVPQSVGPYTDGNANLSPILQVFQPHQGRDLLYKNPKFYDGSTEISASLDNRIPLGTYTLNNRDYWENNNFNESTFQSYLKDNLETHDTIIVETADGPVVRTADDNVYYNQYTAYSWSIDALPFVVNPNNDEIIHLDRYYDKNIEGTVSDLETTNKEAYELATEGKINYHLSPRYSGRLPVTGSAAYVQGAPWRYASTWEETRENIDIFSNRPTFTSSTSGDGSGEKYLEWLITGNSDEAIENLSDNTDGNGMYLFKLNWGDGSELEYTDKPQLLELTTLFEHFYEKPGFYSITGVVYHIGNAGQNLYTWEKFQTNILLNPSPNYELNLLDYNNFASIGGISKDSAFVKSLYNTVGINPLTQDNSRASEEVIEKLNTFDKLQILNVLGKVDYERIQPYYNFLSPYQTPTDDQDSYAFGCPVEWANNYYFLDNPPLPEGVQLIDDGSCVYLWPVTIQFRVVDGPEGDIIEDATVPYIYNTNVIPVLYPAFLLYSNSAYRSIESSYEDTVGNYNTEQWGDDLQEQIEDNNEFVIYLWGQSVNHPFYMISPPDNLEDYELQVDWHFDGWYKDTTGDGQMDTRISTRQASFSFDEPTTIQARFYYQDTTTPNVPENVNVYNRENPWSFYDPFTQNVMTVPPDNDVDGNDVIAIYFDVPSERTGLLYGDLSHFEIRRSYWDYVNESEVFEELPNQAYTDVTQVTLIVNDVNLPYREYTYSIRSVDLSGLTSDYVYSNPIYPTPSDQEPDSLDSNLQGIEQIKNDQLQYTWQQISEAWPGLEGMFKHFKIEIDGPTIDYVENYVGDYNTEISESSDNKIPTEFTFEPEGGLVYKQWSMVGSLEISPWSFKTSVVATSLDPDDPVEQESAATEPIEITPENFISAYIEVGSQYGNPLEYFEIESGYAYYDSVNNTTGVAHYLTTTFDLETSDYAQIQDILSIAQVGDVIDLYGTEHDDDGNNNNGQYEITNINEQNGYLITLPSLPNPLVIQYEEGMPYTGEFRLLRPFTAASTVDSDISLSSYMDEDGNSHIPVPIRYWTYESVYVPEGIQAHNLFIRAFIKGDESTVGSPGITFHGDEYNRIHLGNRYYINMGENQDIDDYVIDLPNDIPVGQDIYIGVYDANDTNLLIDTYGDYSETQPFQIQEVYGCMDVNSDNHESQATVDFNCRYSFIIETESITEDTEFLGTIHAHRLEFKENEDDTLDFNRATIVGQLDGQGTYDNQPTINYNNFETPREFILIYIDDQGGSNDGGGEFKRWEIFDIDESGNEEPARLEFTDDVSWEGNDLVFGNTQTWTENVDDLNFALRGPILAVRPALDENGNNVAGPNNYEDKVIRVVWAQDGIEYDETIALGQLGQDFNLPVYAPVDLDDNEYGTDDYPMDPQPVQVQGAPLFEDYPYDNQSPYGTVGPTSFTLMDNAVIYDEPGSLWGGSEIDLWTRIIEVQVVEPFEQDGVTYTQSLEHWEIKQGLEYIHKIYDANDDRIFNWQVGGSREGFIYAMDQENPEDIHSIKIEYNPADDFNSDVPIIIEAFFSQVDEDGEESGGGKYPGGG